jgi:hypothetical protein
VTPSSSAELRAAFIGESERVRTELPGEGPSLALSRNDALVSGPAWQRLGVEAADEPSS